MIDTPDSPTGNIDYSQLDRGDQFSATLINQWGQQCEQAMLSRKTVACDLHRPAKLALCCKHCMVQDEVHPKGIVYIPKKFYVCTDCFFLLERMKFHVPTEIIVVCSKCLLTEVRRIQQIDPKKYRNLAEEK